MIYTLHSKFEAAIYNMKTKEFSGGSYQIKLNFNRVLSKSEQKEFDSLVDLFDHSTISEYGSSSFSTFIRDASKRYVQTNITVDESIYSKLVFLVIKDYIAVHNINDLTLLFVESFNWKDQSVIITDDDIKLLSTENFQISEETFNS